MAFVEFSRASATPVLEQVVGALRDGGIREDHLRAIYVLGSQLFNIVTESSDFDLLVVVDNSYYGPARIDLATLRLDFHIMREARYLEELRAHNLQFLLSLWVPERCVILQNLKTLSSDFYVCLRYLASGTLLAVERNWGKALRLYKWSLDDVSEEERKQLDYRAKKGLVHALRFCLFGHQILDHGKVVDYEAGNYLLEEVVNSPLPFAELEAKYLVLKNELTSSLPSKIGNEVRFLKLLPPLTRYFDDPSSLSKPVGYINEHSMTQFARVFQVFVMRHPQLRSLFYLCPTEKTKRSNVIGAEISPCVVEQSASGKFELVAMSYSLRYHVSPTEYFNNRKGTIIFTDYSRVETLNLKQEHACIKEMQGLSVAMFFYRGKWRIMTDFTLDGQEEFHAPSSPFTSLSGGSDASLSTNSSTLPMFAGTVGERFWKQWNRKNYTFPSSVTNCYIFSQTKDGSIYLLDIRDNDSLSFLSSSEVVRYSTIIGVETPYTTLLSPKSYEEALITACSLDPTLYKGLTFRYPASRLRFSVTSPQYTAICNFEEKPPPHTEYTDPERFFKQGLDYSYDDANRFVSLSLCRSLADPLPFMKKLFPQHLTLFLEVQLLYTRLFSALSSAYKECMDSIAPEDRPIAKGLKGMSSSSRKRFALTARRLSQGEFKYIATLLFEMRKENVADTHHFLRFLSLSYVCQLLLSLSQKSLRKTLREV